MRTTLDIDDDVLHAAKELAAEEKTTVGKILSDIARKALTGRVGTPGSGEMVRLEDRWYVLLPSGRVVTREMMIEKLIERVDLEDAGLLSGE